LAAGIAAAGIAVAAVAGIAAAGIAVAAGTVGSTDPGFGTRKLADIVAVVADTKIDSLHSPAEVDIRTFAALRDENGELAHGVGVLAGSGDKRSKECKHRRHIFRCYKEHHLQQAHHSIPTTNSTHQDTAD
jgi:hypothetical protein